uniref:Carbonic anhydrase n=1 Tax=Oryza barthii TaxID=65489 RepID=A0A0D3HRK0_9ORYZ
MNGNDAGGTSSKLNDRAEVSSKDKTSVSELEDGNVCSHHGIEEPNEESVQGIVMEQEELSDSEEDSQHVEFEREEMDDSDEDQVQGVDPLLAQNKEVSTSVGCGEYEGSNNQSQNQQMVSKQGAATQKPQRLSNATPAREKLKGDNAKRIGSRTSPRSSTSPTTEPNQTKTRRPKAQQMIARQSAVIRISVNGAARSTFEDAEGNEGPDFTYIQGAMDGPSNWGKLSPEYRMCGEGRSQSPIDINTKTVVPRSDLDTLDRNYNAVNATIVNNGKDITMKFHGEVGQVIIAGKPYRFQAIHWHAPSEHTINGRRFPLELHLVHKSDADGGLAVISVLYKLGAPDSFYLQFKDHLAELGADECDFSKEEAHVAAGLVQMRSLQKRTGSYFRYGAVRRERGVERAREGEGDQPGAAAPAHVAIADQGRQAGAAAQWQGRLLLQPAGQRRLLPGIRQVILSFFFGFLYLMLS